MVKNSKMNNKRSPKSDDGSSSDSDYEEEDVQILDKKEYHKFLNSLFPSKYMKNKIKEESNDNKGKNKSKNKKKDSKRSPKNNKETKKSNNKKSKKKEDKVDIIFTILPPKKKGEEDEDFEDEEYEIYEEDDASSEGESSDEESDDEDSEEEEEEEDEDESGDSEDSEEDEEEDEDTSDEDYSEEDDEEDDEEEYDEDEEEEDESDENTSSSCNEDEDKNGVKTRAKKGKKKNSSNDKNSEKQETNIYDTINDFSKEIKNKYKNEKEVIKTFQGFTKKLKKKQEKFEKKKKTKNLKKYMDLISNKHLISDIKFFKNTMSVNEQDKVLTELESIKKSYNTNEKPYRIQLLENKEIPNKFKAIALKKINSMKAIAEGGGEYSKIKNWVDTFMRIPFNVVNNLPVNKNDNVEEIQSFMEKSQNILDEAVYGMKDAKTQLMQMVAQWVANPNAVGNAIAIKGPMGTGKTTLVKHGVSKLLNREFAFIPLGGATDSSYLEGHSYTYEGSTYGKIVDILLQCKSSNPVIYFDELDKVSETPKGEEIIGILTHLTDTTQNDKFHDKYFSEIDFDMSKCLFIFSYNDESKINPILKDRMYNIETKGYDFKEKIIISNQYLIPKLEKELDMEKGSIIFSDEILKFVIEKYTNEEKGVRNLKRCLEVIYSKLNLYKFMKPGTKLFGESIVENIQFPYTITQDVIEKIIIKPKQTTSGALPMYL